MIRINLKSSIYLSVLAVCTLFTATGCDKLKKKPAVTPPVAQQVPAQKAVAPPVVAVQKQVSSVKLPPALMNQFDFSAKKDPFKPYIAPKTIVPAGKGIKSGGQILPIHSFDLSQFRLAGVVADAKGNKAMVVDPDKKAYVLKVGMTIGKNEGRVTHISTSGVDVVEQFRDDNNKIRKETIRIPLLRKP